MLGRRSRADFARKLGAAFAQSRALVSLYEQSRVGHRYRRLVSQGAAERRAPRRDRAADAAGRNTPIAPSTVSPHISGTWTAPSHSKSWRVLPIAARSGSSQRHRASGTTAVRPLSTTSPSGQILDTASHRQRMRAARNRSPRPTEPPARAGHRRHRPWRSRMPPLACPLRRGGRSRRRSPTAGCARRAAPPSAQAPPPVGRPDGSQWCLGRSPRHAVDPSI